MRSLVIYTLHKYYSGDQIANTEMCGARRMYGSEKRCVKGFGEET
jgi:hypothetical protein